MKKLIYVLALLLFSEIFFSCKGKSEEILILTTSEDFRIEYFQKRLNEQFPDYKITINFFTTGGLAAKLKAEGTSTECDIIGDVDYAYLESLADILADLSMYDTSPFLDNFIPLNRKYLPTVKSTGCIGVNEEFLASRNLPIPSSYQDLINPIYKDVIAMANPKISGTGFFFLKNLVNAWGEDAAFDYFDKLADNLLQFTSTGAGPINSLFIGEVGIALGMTYQLVTVINSRNAPLSIYFFEEGSPYSLYGTAMIKGKETRKSVREVFEFYAYTLNNEDKELFAPEQIFKDQINNIPNYPKNVLEADMRGIESLSEKERLLEKWKY